MRFIRTINEAKSSLTTLDSVAIDDAIIKKDLSVGKIGQPVISIDLLKRLEHFDLGLYSYKEGRRNVYMIVDLENHEIVDMQRSGDHKLFALNYVLALISDVIIENILDTYRLEKSDKKFINMEGDFYKMQSYSLTNNTENIYIPSTLKQHLNSYGIVFKIENSYFFSYIPVHTYDAGQFNLQLISRKNLSEEENKQLLNHLDSLHLSEYDSDLFG